MNRKILIIGLGSIGKRHLKNIISLGYENITLIRRKNISIKEFPNFKIYTSIADACKVNSFDTAIIATPTSNHFKDFLEISKYKIKNVYIEKPISFSIEEAKKIEEITNKLNLNVVIGFDLHFDLGLLKVKDLLSKKIIGKVCAFHAEVGQYLPDWRPHEDYREGMSAKKDLGGGVMLDLIHEFDYINWLLGPIKNIFGKNNHISSLEIETEDVSINLAETTNGILGTISLDYLQKELSRTCKIIGDKGTIIWNYKDSKVTWMTHNNLSWQEFNYNHIERNDRFISIIKAFLNSNSSEVDQRLTKVSFALESLQIVLKAKKSNIENKLMEI